MFRGKINPLSKSLSSGLMPSRTASEPAFLFSENVEYVIDQDYENQLRSFHIEEPENLLDEPCFTTKKKKGENGKVQDVLLDISNISLTSPPRFTSYKKKSKSMRPLAQSFSTFPKEVPDTPLEPENSPLFKPILPVLGRGSHSDLNCITPETATSVISGDYDECFSKIHFIDCRYQYEYEGGHVRNAVNVQDPKELPDMFLSQFIGKDPKEAYSEDDKPVAIIFYCEFSSKRGPAGYRHLREADRNINFSKYPLVHYPQLYLIEGGYKNFFSKCTDFCEPREYIEMKDKRFGEKYTQICKDLQHRAFKRSRSLTFASLPLRPLPLSPSRCSPNRPSAVDDCGFFSPPRSSRLLFASPE